MITKKKKNKTEEVKRLYSKKQEGIQEICSSKEKKTLIGINQE